MRTLLIPLLALAYLGVTAWQNHQQHAARPNFPDFNLPIVGQDSQYLSRDEALKGPTLVVFWASWCGPCKAQREILAPWVQRENNANQLLGIATLDSVEQVNMAEKISPHPFPSVTDEDGKIAEKLGIQALPVSLLIDRERRVLRRFTGPLSPTDLQIIAQDLKTPAKS